MSEHTKTLALYRSVNYQYTTIQEVTPNYEDDNGYVRISHSIEVDFIERDQADVQEAMIKGTLNEMESVEEDYNRTRAKLEEKLNELRALPAPEKMAAA
jgi:hypothetical protein